jgi:hypothetical protein
MIAPPGRHLQVTSRAARAVLIVSITQPGAGDQPGARMDAYAIPTAEIFDRAAVPPEIAELLEEWPEIDPGTARLIRAAITSGESNRMRRAWQLLAARAELAAMMRPR